MLVSPIYTGQVNGNPLRFFETPNTDGIPDLPWHCFEDLLEAAKMPNEIRVDCIGKSKSAHKHFYPTVSTGGELVTIAPHFSATRMIMALCTCKLIKASFMGEYLRAMGSAYFTLPDVLSEDHLELAVNRWFELDMLN